MSITRFGEQDGTPVDQISLRSPSSGIEAEIIGWGAVVRDLHIRLPSGKRQRVVLGLNTLDDYIAHSPHMGAIAGRFANRIANGRFVIDGVTHEVTRNQADRHTLHGGNGFGRRPWTLVHHDDASVKFGLISPDGDNGFPGKLLVACTYRLLDPGILRIELEATTDKPTPVNLTHHSYFNLDDAQTIFDHRLSVDADFYTPTDADLIPTGEILSVNGSANDFRAHRTIRFPDAQTGAPVHYDVNFVLRRDRTEPPAPDGSVLAHAATLSSRINNLALEVWTTERGLQVYDGGKLNIPVPGLDGAMYGPGSGVCLETQNFPDAVNRSHFPSCILRPGETYKQVTEYRFVPG